MIFKYTKFLDVYIFEKKKSQKFKQQYTISDVGNTCAIRFFQSFFFSCIISRSCCGWVPISVSGGRSGG